MPTDDEIGAYLIDSWKGRYAYFWEQWYCYERGYWRREKNLAKPIWMR